MLWNAMVRTWITRYNVQAPNRRRACQRALQKGAPHRAIVQECWPAVPGGHGVWHVTIEGMVTVRAIEAADRDEAVHKALASVEGNAQLMSCWKPTPSPLEGEGRGEG